VHTGTGAAACAPGSSCVMHGQHRVATVGRPRTPQVVPRPMLLNDRSPKHPFGPFPDVDTLDRANQVVKPLDCCRPRRAREFRLAGDRGNLDKWPGHLITFQRAPPMV
jgi:hypothetical protein